MNSYYSQLQWSGRCYKTFHVILYWCFWQHSMLLLPQLIQVQLGVLQALCPGPWLQLSGSHQVSQL